MNLSFFKKAMRPPTRNGAIASAFGLVSPDVLSGDHPGYPASGDRPDHPASGDRPDHQADGPDSAAAAGSGFQARDGATTRATTVPLPEERDHRLRGLRTEPTGDVPATSTRTDRRQHRHSRGGLLAKVAVFVAVVALAVVLLQAFVIQPFAVPGGAMAPTLQAGDRILVLKSGLLAGGIYSGEIVVFHAPQSLPCTVVGGHGVDLVLRVVALPGQVIRSVGGTIFVNGRQLRERGWYDLRFGEVASTPIRTTVLAPGQYFVMADNRSDACDSRVFGPISRSSVVGTGIAVVGRHGHAFFATL